MIMILKEDSTEQKLRGAYYTPLKLAEKMVGFFVHDKAIHRILEPSCGDGVFIDAALREGLLQEGMSLTAIEIEECEAKKLADRVENCKNIQVYNMDFFHYYQMNKAIAQYDLILGNPPYIRYQYLQENQRTEMSKLLTEHGMKSNKLINTWVGFMVACVHFLSENGKIAFIIPAEILQVVYAQDLRLFLSNELSKITLITFEELVFPDIEQEVVVFIGEKSVEDKGIRIIELNNLDDLNSLDFQTNGFQKLNHVHEKWTKYFTNSEENKLISSLRKDCRFQKLSDTALINVGITTGNNKYFSATKKIVKEYDFENIVRPLIGRSSHANSVYFTQKDWEKNVEDGKAAYLIDFPNIPFEKYPSKHQLYISEGEKRGENKGYKCSIRDNWYCIPSIWIPDAFFLRRNNLYPKFVLNCCDAVSTDTMHRIKFRDTIAPERIVLSYYNSISFAFTEISGRSYGGGVLEILPGEVGNIIVPVLDDIPIEKIKEVLKEVDAIVRREENIELALDLVDNEILINNLSIEQDVCAKSRKIWKKLQSRRLKRG